MSRDDYVATMWWLRAKGAQFAMHDSNPPVWFLPDGSCFELATIEACTDFDAVKALVLGEVGVTA